MATSGTAERGAHIVDPRTGRSAVTDLVAVTVVGPRLTWADCLGDSGLRDGFAPGPGAGWSPCRTWRPC